MRVVSLLPATTDLLYAVGADVVGVTFECTVPPGADPRIVVGGVDTSAMSPGEIDAYVRAAVARGDDLYTLHADALGDLDPDVVVAQDLCRVCALPSDQVGAALAHLGCTARVVTHDPHTLDGVLEACTVVGAEVGRAAGATALVSDLRRRLARVSTAVEGRSRPRVTVVEWVDPLFLAGHWVPDLVTAAGGEPVAHHRGERSYAEPWTALTDADADLVVVAPCGYDLDGAAGQAVEVAARVPGVPVWAIDADALVVRPGPGLVDGVEALAAALHPGAVAPHHGVRRVA